jgi:hypothetical protein
MAATPDIYCIDDSHYWGDWHRERTVGPELADNISPTGWVRKRGMMFSSHHDAPFLPGFHAHSRWTSRMS